MEPPTSVFARDLKRIRKASFSFPEIELTPGHPKIDKSSDEKWQDLLAWRQARQAMSGSVLLTTQNGIHSQDLVCPVHSGQS